jgi:AcrR family transcriptional regulator
MAYRTSEKMAARKQARRRRFLDTAIAVFGHFGYHAATVPMIVTEAQSSTGAFYLYFRNKEDVFAEALRDIGGNLAAALSEAIGREDEPARKMGAAVEAFVRWLAENPAETRILMEAATLGGRPEEVRRAIIESHTRSVEAALEFAAPWIDARDRGTVARCWVGAALEAALGWLRTEPVGRSDPQRLGSVVRNFNLRGAGIPAGR